MKLRSLLTGLSCLLFLGFTGIISAAEVWNLPPVSGNNSASGPVWKEGWTHAAGNPLTERAAQWTAAYTEGQSPELQGPYLPMKPGSYCNFNLIWLNGEEKAMDPAHQLRDHLLSARSGKDPQHGPLSLILFTPPAPGSFQLTLQGKVSVQNPTAGHARLAIFKLADQRQKVEVIKEFELNKKVPNAHGGFPDQFQFDAAVELKAGEELAVGIQSVNPGPASAGSSAANFQTFRITKQ